MTGPIGYIEVQIAVVVIIPPGGGRSLSLIPNAGKLGHVREAFSPIIMKKNVGTVSQYIEIAPSVIVIVRPDRSTAPQVGQTDARRKW